MVYEILTTVKFFNNWLLSNSELAGYMRDGSIVRNFDAHIPLLEEVPGQSAAGEPTAVLFASQTLSKSIQHGTGLLLSKAVSLGVPDLKNDITRILKLSRCTTDSLKLRVGDQSAILAITKTMTGFSNDPERVKKWIEVCQNPALMLENGFKKFTPKITISVQTFCNNFNRLTDQQYLDICERQCTIKVAVVFEPGARPLSLLSVSGNYDTIFPTLNNISSDEVLLAELSGDDTLLSARDTVAELLVLLDNMSNLIYSVYKDYQDLQLCNLPEQPN